MVCRDIIKSKSTDYLWIYIYIYICIFCSITCCCYCYCYCFVGWKMNEGEKNNENLFCTSPRLLQIIPIFNFPLCVSINEYIFSFYTTRTTLHQLNYRLYLSQVLRWFVPRHKAYITYYTLNKDNLFSMQYLTSKIYPSHSPSFILFVLFNKLNGIL